MALLEFFSAYWWVVLVVYGSCFAFLVFFTVSDELRALGHKLRVTRSGLVAVPNGTDAAADSDSDRDCAANLERAVKRGAGRRSIQRSDGWAGAGADVPRGAHVLADEKAVA